MLELLRTYQKTRVTVLSSDTGSGKSTQVPQLILYDEWASGLGVVCIQPRVLAAKGVAERVADELDVELGEEVGYHVRFDAKRGNKTRLTYLTEGILIREATNDRNVSRYACVIIDEAHERTINTDILMALLKGVISRREDFRVGTISNPLCWSIRRPLTNSFFVIKCFILYFLSHAHKFKVIVMLATLDAASFQAYFNEAPHIYIPGRIHPVSVAYLQGETPDYISLLLVSSR
jgi:pre-mRNA-splicing factor ATP-dependent RNA helicase DHX15/PRP43